MMEIKVVVPDALAASDLTWFLDASARVSKNPDGVCVVYVQVGENVQHILSEIRNWLTLNHVGAVVVHVGDDSHTLAPES
jgi:hypothetical protein